MNTCYLLHGGGMPLAFMEEDFLVKPKLSAVEVHIVCVFSTCQIIICVVTSANASSHAYLTCQLSRSFVVIHTTNSLFRSK